jgi:AraC-like DNA-binding protein
MQEEICSFPAAMNDDRPFHLEMAGISWCDGSYAIERKKSPFYAFEYIVSGTGTLIENGFTCNPSAGDVYILQKGSTHRYVSDDAKPWVKIWFAARGPLLDLLMPLYNLQQTFFVSRCAIEQPFREIISAAKTGLREEGIMHNTVAVLAHGLIQQLSLKAGLYRSPLSTDVQKVKAYLDRSVESRVNLKDVDRIISKSSSQTIRKFKKETGVTPYQYLLDRKIATAKLLLQHTRTSVKEIAYKLKFADEHYFSGLFKKKTGKSPIEFRNG